MAGLSAAWRLSEPGWRDRFESITVYQRGWRSRRQGRLEPRATRTDRGARPACLAGFLRERLRAASRVLRRTRPCHNGSRGAHPHVGPGDRFRPTISGWRTDRAMTGWCGRDGSPATTSCPVSRDATGRELTVVGFLRRALQLILDFSDSLGETTDGGLVCLPPPDTTSDALDRSGPRGGALATLAAPANPLPPEAIRAGLLGTVPRRCSPSTRLRAPTRPQAILAADVASGRNGARTDRRQFGHRPSRFQSHQ